MISAPSRSVGSCDRCVSAMALYELAEPALHIRRLPAITTTQPVLGQRLFCLIWIALTYCILPKGERRSSAQGKDPGHCRSSEIDLSQVLVQQHYVIGYCAGLLPTLFLRVRPVIAPSCSGFTIGQCGGILS
jgi:hypothetical protein